MRWKFSSDGQCFTDHLITQNGESEEEKKARLIEVIEDMLTYLEKYKLSKSLKEKLCKVGIAFQQVKHNNPKTDNLVKV